jgi:protein O-mannosyl-transferase
MGKLKSNNKIMVIITPILLGITTFFFYCSTLYYGFIFDDLPCITDNFTINTMDQQGGFFAWSRWIPKLLDKITYKYWGTNPFAYRIFNLFIHIFIGIMIFILLFKVLKKFQENSFIKNNAYLISTLATGLFLLHPVQTQTATYITQMRLEGLTVFFAVAVLLSFFYATQERDFYKKLALYALSFMLITLAAGTKEIAIVIPFLIAIFDWCLICQGDWKVFKKRLPIHLAYLAIMLLLLFKVGFLKPNNVANIATNSLSSNRGNLLTTSASSRITPFIYFISQFKIILHYIKIFIIPINLSFDYDIVLSSGMLNMNVIIPFLILLSMGLSTIALLIQKKHHIISFCSFWFFISILPRASIFPSTELVCDYKTYIASLGIMLLISIILTKLIIKISEQTNIIQTPASKIACISIMILCLGVATKARNFVWSSEYNFWENTAKHAPKGRVLNNLAASLNDLGRKDEAIETFKKSIAKDPNYGEPHVNLGTLYLMKSEKKLAAIHFQRALEIGEQHPELYHNLGVLHFMNNDFENAENCFRKAVQLRPHYSKVLTCLGGLYLQQNRLQEAAKCYKQAIEGDFVDQEIYYMHAQINYNLGNFDSAANSLEKIDKKYKDVAFLLGTSFYNLNKRDKAAKNLEIAFNQDKTNLSCAYNYGQALIDLQRWEQACKIFELCKKAENVLPYSPMLHAKCLHEMGQSKEAKMELENIISKTKNVNVKRDSITLIEEIESTKKERIT